ncbi:CMRF35-like molecule 8 [Amphiprion ocellaris]|uniref:CMRF35-like molecule 8 n=1 Tax=Amphiprion ocellaris TaxID=80972 RepID=UPI0024116399|nr:CMRF35-like molecule 8 [Amphiprion ocellaris]
MKTISVFYCLLCATLTKGAEINVEGFEGGEVSFKSSHRLARNYNKYLCIDPCKSSQDILVTVQSGKRAKSGRITLVDSGDGSFTVTFSQLQLSDSKEYLCAVDRPGLDTYTSVHLTVKKVVPNETTVTPDVSSTWTYQNVTNSTQITTEIDILWTTNISTASNFTNGIEQNIWTGTILHVTIGGVAMIIILMLLAMWGRKRKEISKPQLRVCSNSRDVGNAHESEVDCEYDDIESVVQHVKKLPESASVGAPLPKQNPPTSGATAAECARPIHIYENISFSKGAAGSNVPNNPNIISGMYIKPLPPVLCKKPADGCPRKHTKPKSVWFGLDLTGMNLS